MRATRRRKRRRAAELTPLIDVLFILLFAALVQARSAGPGTPRDRAPGDPIRDAGAGNDAGSSDATAPDAGAGDANAGDANAGDANAGDAGAGDAGGAYRAAAVRAAEALVRTIGDRDVVVIEITADGVLDTVTHWRDGERRGRHEIAHPLVRAVPPSESDIELEYRGDVGEAHRICSIAADYLAPRGAGDGAIVLIATAAPHADLPWALRGGLERDIQQCFNDIRGLAVLMRPAAAAAGHRQDPENPENSENPENPEDSHDEQP